MDKFFAFLRYMALFFCGIGARRASIRQLSAGDYTLDGGARSASRSSMHSKRRADDPRRWRRFGAGTRAFWAERRSYLSPEQFWKRGGHRGRLALA